MSTRTRLGALLAGALLGAGAAAVVGVAPAHAALPDKWGFAFMHDPTPAPGTVLDPTRQYGSWKAAFPSEFATVDHLAPGSYRVRFPRIGVFGGVAHVTAVVSTTATWCQLGRWFPDDGDQLVEVQCYGTGGVPRDSRFSITFTERSTPLSVPGGGFAYARVSPAGALIDSFNSAGDEVFASPDIFGTGRYQVILLGVGEPPDLAGNVQLTAESNEPRRCVILNHFGVAHLIFVDIQCHDAAGQRAATAFTLTYHRERAIVGELAPPKKFGYIFVGAVGSDADHTNFNSAGATNTVVPTGAGRFRVVFGQVGVGETIAGVTTESTKGSTSYCVLQEAWGNVGGDARVGVTCFDNDGVPIDSRALVTFSSRL